MANTSGDPSPLFKASRSWWSSFIIGIAIRLGLTGGLILVIAFAGVVLFLFPWPRSLAEFRFPGLLALVTLSLVAWSFIIWLKGSQLSKNRKESLDRAFVKLADKTSHYTRTGRRYHGVFGQRQFDAYVTQVKEAHAALSTGVYVGEHLEVVLDSKMKVRLKAGPHDQLLAKAGNRLNDDLNGLTEESPEGLVVYVYDVEWGRRFLRDDSATALLVELLSPLGFNEMRNLSLWPGGAMLSLHRLDPENLNAENVKNWLTRLADLLEHLERLPPPEQEALESKWYSALRGDRRLIYKIAWGSLASFLLFIAVLIVCGLWLSIRS